MSEHKTTEGVYGPGTYTDTEFISVPEDSRRLLKHLASITPGFTNDPTLLDDVEFTGGDLPIIPGPIKAQVLVRFTTLRMRMMAADQSSVRSHPCHDRHNF